MDAEKPKIYSSIQIGAGIVCLILGISTFVLAINFILGVGILCFGAGNILAGITDGKSNLPRDKNLSYLSAFFLLSGAIAIIYYTGFTLK